ncbi:MAG: bifunctional pyr operon transcriptional regulator/uracil phosphoribosyltransferase PyrR, partial [Chitinophagia bacterium]|nr:bifunctional pyr operon transcriptional regulator/uracil phosphoribosyltransferase PyrR [Chitinophagia bacterium]
MKTLLNSEKLHITLNRLAHRLVENYFDSGNLVIIGIQPRGVLLSQRIYNIVCNLMPDSKPEYGVLDITFHRDDVHNHLRLPNITKIETSIENKKVVLIDDVLYTGRTIRSALDALLDFGRPAKVELLTLIDRRFNRELPVQPDYVGMSVDTILSQHVVVKWSENAASE